MLTLTNEDNKEMLRRYPDGYFDLAIVDPPYGLKEDGRKKRPHTAKQKNGNILKIKPTGYTPEKWDNNTPDDEYFELLFKKSKQQIVCGGNYFKQIVGEPFKAPRRHQYGQFIKERDTNWIIWDKVNGDSDFSDCELIWTSFQRKTDIFYFMWAGMMQGKSILEGRVMQGNKSKNEKRIHPTQKPVALYKYLLSTLELTASTKIVDTHFGSGSIGIATEEFGYNLTACETNKTYYDKALKRIEQHKSQLKMF
jgi:site-specific DNA-methyltransferase (adenine-specific)